MTRIFLKICVRGYANTPKLFYLSNRTRQSSYSSSDTVNHSNPSSTAATRGSSSRFLVTELQQMIEYDAWASHSLLAHLSPLSSEVYSKMGGRNYWA